jgi:hypothetical protein
MLLSLTKAAHAALSSEAWQEIRVRELDFSPAKSDSFPKDGLKRSG